MAIFTEKVKYFLSGKKVSLCIILLAITGRIIQLVYFFNIRVDGMYQHLATLNLLNGHGVSLGNVLPGDLSSTIYEPLINWPPGYSFLLAPFYLLFNNNYIAAGLTLDILAAVTLILVFRKILKLFDVPVFLLNISTLIIGFFIYYFYLIASSDAVAISIFITGLYFTISLIKSNSNWLKNTIALTICFALCAYIKYLFLPVAIIVPVYLYFKGVSVSSSQLKKAGIFTFAFIVVAISSLLIYQKSVSGSAGYISQPQRGFFPEHVLSAYPFIPASFLQPESIAIFTHQAKGLSFFLARVFQILHLFLFTAIALFIIKKKSAGKFKKISPVRDFLYITFFISLMITLLLLVLSIWVEKEEILPGYFWTYIEDPRYYGLPVILIQLSFIIIYKDLYSKSRQTKYLCWLLSVLLLAEFSRGVLFTLNRIKNYKREEYSWQYEDRFQQYATSLIKKEVRPLEEVVITGPPYVMTNRISLYTNFPVLNDASTINNLSSLRTKRPVLLFIVLHAVNYNEYKTFLLNSNIRKIGSFDKYSFFVAHIIPD